MDGLFAVAAELGMETAVHDALTGGGVGRVLVAAIGPVTAEALEGRRVGVGVCPLQPRIPALATALAAAPIEVPTIGELEVNEARILIKDPPRGRVVTIIEVLSPSNKAPGSTATTSFFAPLPMPHPKP